MSPNNYHKRVVKLEEICNQIWSQRPIYFNNLVPSMLETIGAVYLIAQIETDEVLYVGRTVNLRRRLYTNHLMGNKSTARLKKYLIEDPRMPQINTFDDAKSFLREFCYFKFIQENNSISRGLYESGITYAMNARYLSIEH